MAYSFALRFPPINPKPSPPSHARRHLVSFPSPLAVRLPLSGILLPPLALRRRALGIAVGASSHAGSGFGSEEEAAAAAEAEAEARGQSTLPERFRPLTKEAPDRPLRWPWLVAAAFLVYAWRAVFWELSNWKKAVVAILGFIGYIAKLILAIIYQFVGTPITALIECIEFCLNFARSIYSSIVAFTPVQELTTIIILTSLVLAISEAASPDSVNEQPYLLTAAGLVGFGAVRGFVPEALFWLALVGFFCYSKFFKKRNGVSAALPSTAVLAAVGEPWVRALSMTAFLAYAIFYHSKSAQDGSEDEIARSQRRLPVPLLFAALAIGIHVAAKWIRYRHLTWMIV